MTTLEDQVNANLVPVRLAAALAGLFGVFGALLAAIGTYGLLAYSVARRINEIGIRMALGAARSDIAGGILREALTTTSAGLLIGAPIAYAARRAAASLVPGLPAGGTVLLAPIQ